MPLPKERYITVLGGYTLDMHNHGALVKPPAIDTTQDRDYGADPIGNGMFRMIPSGDIVDATERDRRRNAK